MEAGVDPDAGTILEDNVNAVTIDDLQFTIDNLDMLITGAKKHVEMYKRQKEIVNEYITLKK